MDFSNIAVKVLAAKAGNLVKSSAQFWTRFPEREILEKYAQGNAALSNTEEGILQKFLSTDLYDGFVCAFDEGFPLINPNVKKGSKPYFLLYKGDLSLLNDLNRNIAVIGLIDPTEEIRSREAEVVKQLVKHELTIVSGLANGCDAIAHKVCIENGGKTIAILPSTLEKIVPTENRSLAKEIVANGGLILSEYYREPVNKMEAINRYLERDRLQAMFAKAVVLIASYRKGEGDSGSRHAMEAAQSYGIERYVMFNEKTDSEDKRFGLNKDFVQLNYSNVKILNNNAVESIKTLLDPKLAAKTGFAVKQLTFLDNEK